MKSAYLYVRVSTDEQKRKGYSLIEQEDRLKNHCEFHGIQVKGIFREDHSAKNFNRPEWKKLIKKIKNSKARSPENILFIKWDRFSRSIEYAYQMIRLLRELNVQPMAIDQPIDLEVPESIVMLAVYLSIPEAENTRRGLTTSDGIRRAKKLGRWSGKAPIGYANKTTPDGKAYIEPKQPEADHIKWSFQQLATGSYTISQIRKMAAVNGLQCSRNNFWKLVHNPIYCGLIRIPANRNEEEQFVQAVHEPLITEHLFREVQQIITKDRNKRCNKDTLKYLFPLRGFLTCQFCGRKITASQSQGKHLKYPYYHCSDIKCKFRLRADVLNNCYEEQLRNIRLHPKAYELFNLILEDENIFTNRREHSDELKQLKKDITTQEAYISKARKFFLEEKIDLNDFSKLKKEHNAKITQLNNRLEKVTQKIASCERNHNQWPDPEFNILRSYKELDIKGRREIISLFKPTSINTASVSLNPLEIDPTISLIVKH